MIGDPMAKVEIECDECGLRERHQLTGDLRLRLEDDGWIIEDEYTLCPGCAFEDDEEEESE